MKNFVTMSRDQAKRYTYKPQSEDYIIISINEPNEKPPKFNRNSRLKDVLYLYFEDFSEEDIKDKESNDYILMSNQDAFNIIQFIDKHSKVNNIIIHCAVGVSRSVSIRCALEECYNNRTVGKFVPDDLPKSDEVYKLSDLLKEVEQEKKNGVVWIHNKTCYEMTKFAFKYIRFKEKYKDRPDLFAEEILGVKLLSYQKVFLKAISKFNNISFIRRRWF